MFRVAVKKFSFTLTQADHCGTFFRKDHRPGTGSILNIIFLHGFTPHFSFIILFFGAAVNTKTNGRESAIPAFCPYSTANKKCPGS